MRGDNHLLALSTTTDEVTGEVKPVFSFNIQICKATEDVDVKFDIAAPSGAERKQVYVDTATGEVVEDADCPRGLRVGDDFRVIPTEAITEVKGQKTNMIVALGQIPLDDVDFTLTDGIYFVQMPPKGGSATAYRLVYEALRADKKAKRGAQGIVVKRTPRTNEKLGVIYADEQHGCLMLAQMHFAAELRQPDAAVLAPQEAEVTAEQVAVAVKVLALLPDGGEVIANAVDENVERKRDLMEKAVAGEVIAAPEPIKATVQQDDLMAALEASLALA